MVDVQKVSVPVLGKVNKTYLYIGAAGIAGFVGYAWFSGGRGGGGGETVTPTPDPVTDYEPPTVVDSNGSYGPPAPGPVPGMPVSNVEWHTMARDQADALRFNEQLVESAIQKYLAKDDLTAAEMSVILAITAIIGTPPQNGPFPIRLGLPTPPAPHDGDTLPAPGNFNPVGNSPTTVVLQWNRVPGAILYQVRRDDQGPWIPVGPVERITVPAPTDQRDHKFAVRAIDSHGKAGAEATGTAGTISTAKVNENLAHYAGR